MFKSIWAAKFGCFFLLFMMFFEVFEKKTRKKFVESEKSITFAVAFREMRIKKAEIAQLVEHNLAKVGVAGPSPVFRSTC